MTDEPESAEMKAHEAAEEHIECPTRLLGDVSVGDSVTLKVASVDEDGMARLEVSTPDDNLTREPSSIEKAASLMDNEESE